MNKAYEITLWNGTCMPGKEIKTVVVEELPAIGETIEGLRVKHIWRTGAKDESPERYAVVVATVVEKVKKV